MPKVIALFWVVKILTTAMGESTSDYLVKRINPFIAVGLGFILLVVTLILQFSARRYVASVYWLAAVGVSVFGTMAADVLHVQFGVPYVVSSAFYGVVLAVIFALWYKSEKTLSFHSIYTKRREMFYWAAVLATFALGTATGDLTAVTLHLGYLVSGLLFTGIILIPAAAYFLFSVNEVFCFWFAYVITRPLGASFADWFGKPTYVGGLGHGDGTVSLILTVLIILLVGYLSISGVDRQGRDTPS